MGTVYELSSFSTVPRTIIDISTSCRRVVARLGRRDHATHDCSPMTPDGGACHSSQPAGTASQASSSHSATQTAQRNQQPRYESLEEWFRGQPPLAEDCSRSSSSSEAGGGGASSDAGDGGVTTTFSSSSSIYAIGVLDCLWPTSSSRSGTGAPTSEERLEADAREISEWYEEQRLLDDASGRYRARSRRPPCNHSQCFPLAQCRKWMCCSL